MDALEWRFRLEGDEFDIASVTELFSDEAKLMKDSNGQTELIMGLPFTKDQSHEALNVAKGLLAKLNAIAQIMYGNHESITIVGVGCKDVADGPMHLFINLSDSIRARDRIGMGGSLTQSGVPAPLPEKIGDQFLEAAYKDPDLDRALYLFGSLPADWRGLYMVWEVARDHCGGEKGLIAKNWVPAKQIEDFRATANSYKALGNAARHGSTTTGIDKPRLTLEDARGMIRTILEKWCKEA